MVSTVMMDVAWGRYTIRLLLGITVVTGIGARLDAQQHVTGLALTKSCPSTANQGDTVECTVTVENQDPDHGVLNLVITNQVPFPGGSITQVSGCAAVLAAHDITNGSGPDFTSCTFNETLDLACSGVSIAVVDQVQVEGVDADPILLPDGFGGLPVSNSTTTAIVVTCVGPPSTTAPLISWAGVGMLLAGLVGSGVFRLRRIHG
jgi:hypothetical protein